VLQELSSIARVTAVAGNSDAGLLAQQLPREVRGSIEGIHFLVCHDKLWLARRHIDPVREGIDLVVTGHTHAAFVDWIDGVLYLNPGAASGPAWRRRTIAVIEVDRDGLDPHIVDLGHDRSATPDAAPSNG